MELQILDSFPEILLETTATDLHKILSGPTLIHLNGERTQPVFVSVLLHGNETTGWLAIQSLLKKYQQRALPRSISLFIGNISAAKHAARRLEGQPDYNRVWSTAHNHSDSAEHALMQQVVDIMRERQVFLSIDIHNNTGLNPHYACINRLENSFFHIATLFSKIVIHFTYPEGVQSLAFAPYCPAVTIECGQVGYQHGVSHAEEFIEKCIYLESIPEHSIIDEDIDLFENFATVRISHGVTFSFDNDDDVDLMFYSELDRYNFTHVPIGTPFAKVLSHKTRVLDIITNEHEDVTDQFFEIKDGELITVRRLMPSMFSTDADIVKKDCLCYLMVTIQI